MTTRAAPASAVAHAEPSGSAAAPVRAEPASVHASPGRIASHLSGGSPLPPTLRSRMEYSFGQSFDDVRIHTGGEADRAARHHHAEALTVGSHIAFAPGRFDPATASGEHLVAHELAHVAQQRGSGGGMVQSRAVDSIPGEPAEIAAENAATRAVRGERVQISGPDYSIRNRVMRRARITPPPPPPNPAPLRGRVPPPVVSPGAPPPPAARAVTDAIAAAPPERVAAVLETAVAPKPAPAGGQGEMVAQEQTEEAREAAKEAIEETPAPAEPGAEVPEVAGGAAAEAAPAAVVEPPSAVEADKKEEAAADAEGEKAGEEAKGEEAAAEAGPAPADRAPASPDQDPAFQRVIARGRAVAKQQAHNNTANRKAAEAQAAAAPPANELEGLAGGNQVGKMAEQEPAPFDKESFKAALIAKINEIAPGTLEDADEFKKRGKAGQLKGAVVGQVEAGKETAQGPIKDTAQEAPSTAGVEGKTVTPQPPTEPGPPPPDIGASAAAPKPKSDAEVSLDESPKSVDEKMAEAKVTEDTLANSNEPEFVAALDEKKKVEEHAATAPEAYRADEAGLVANSEAQAAGTAQAQTTEMFGSRSTQFAGVQGEQDSARSGDTMTREGVIAYIDNTYKTTREGVTKDLETLDADVNKEFDKGSEDARKAFENEVETEKEAWKSRRYEGAEGKLRWVRDLFLPLPDEVNQIYQAARQHYIDAMSRVIDTVAGIVETGLNGAQKRIRDARTDIATFVGKLEGDLKQVGVDAAAAIQSKFDDLAADVQNAQTKMIDGLAQKYVDNLKAIDARIDAMKQEDRGLLGRAMDAIGGVIDTILQLKEILLGILAKAADVIDTIIKDPIGFLGNLVAGIKAGLSAFLGNIGEHLKSGLMGWLFGAVAAAGITMPESFDLKGILSLGAQILGLTYANIRARAVRIVGEPVVKALETAVEIFRILMTEGVGGVWNYIKDMLGNLAETVLETIRNWVITKVITAGITWILSLLNPASAFVRACKMIIDVVMFFVERGSQIISLVNAVLDSIAAIASGAIGAMASAVEGALAKAVPIAISFLASLLGLGGISDMIRGAIEKIQAPVNKAIDWLIGKAVKLVKSIGGLFGKKKKPDEEEPEETPDPEHDAKVQAGLAAIDAEEQKYLESGAITQEDAQKVAGLVKGNHPIFTSLVVVEGAGTWDYDYTASRKKKKKGEPQKGPDEPLEVPETILARPSFRPSTKEAVPIATGEDRRHIEAWQVLHERMKLALIGKTIAQAAKLMERLGYPPAAVTNDAVIDAARERLRDQFNSEANLWAGGSKENQDKGRQFAVAKRRADQALETGDKIAFEDALVTCESLWRDPDPSGVKEGYINVTRMTITLMRRNFRNRWPDR